MIPPVVFERRQNSGCTPSLRITILAYSQNCVTGKIYVQIDNFKKPLLCADRNKQLRHVVLDDLSFVAHVLVAAFKN